MNSLNRNILYIADNRLSLNNAAIVNIVEMCNAFSKNGFSTTLIVPDCGMSDESLFKYHDVKYPFKIIKIKIPKAFINKWLPGLVTIFSFFSFNLLRKLEYSLVYTRTTWIFFIVSVLLRRPCFVETHQFRFNSPMQTFIYRKLVKLGMKSPYGGMVCISKELKKQWLNEGLDKNNVHVAHDGFNLNKFGNAVSKIDARQKLGFNMKQLIVTYTGSLIPGKGVDVLIRCANRLPGVTFVIVGGKKEEIQRLKGLSKSNNVIFIGHVQPVMVPLYQAAADILALPNTKGSLIDDVTSPMKLFEYMASRRPIVATDIPSVLEVLKNNFNALISPNGDDHSLSQNIKSYLINPSMREKTVKNALCNLENYSWDSRVKFLSNLFEEKIRLYPVAN